MSQALDKDNDGSLSLQEFLDASNRMAEIMKRQDAQEQKKKLNCLIFKSPIIQKHNDFSKVPQRFVFISNFVFLGSADKTLYKVDCNKGWHQYC